VYISEVMAGRSDNGNYEFIELFNDSDNQVDLTGWSIKKESSNKNVNNETNQLHNNTNNTNNQNEKRKEKIVENINLVPQMHIFPPPENSNTTNTGNIVQQRFIKQKIQSDTNVAQYLNYDKNNDNKRSSNKSLEKISLQNNGNKKNETPLKGNNYNLIS